MQLSETSSDVHIEFLAKLTSTANNLQIGIYIQPVSGSTKHYFRGVYLNPDGITRIQYGLDVMEYFTGDRNSYYTYVLEKVGSNVTFSIKNEAGTVTYATLNTTINDITGNNYYGIGCGLDYPNASFKKILIQKL